MNTRQIDVKKVVGTIDDYTELEHFIATKGEYVTEVTTAYHGLQVSYVLPIDEANKDDYI